MDRSAIELGNRFGLELGDEDEAGSTLDEREDAVLVGRGADDGVDFPVSDLAAVVRLGGSLGDMPFARESTARVVTAVSLAALLGGVTELGVEEPTTFLVGPYIEVDGLVADGEGAISSKAASDLLRTPLLFEPRPHESPVGFGEALITART